MTIAPETVLGHDAVEHLLAAAEQTGSVRQAELDELVEVHEFGPLELDTLQHELEARGVEVRTADYAKPETLAAAFAGAEKVLLISSSEVGQRAPQHLAVIDAAKKAGVKLIAYTSILHADTSKMVLATGV